ncbi:MAG: AmmeMemoRadiSam system radical SAM enzyme [Thermodesulfobacteriota bacterium]|nr:AmmeMemoRadiSam system radical SAM enzyme [Thermodesulfobacteriota bacterium]
MKEAMLYVKEEEQKVRCNLCNHHCLIMPGKHGICGVRENRDGMLYSLVYGQVIARHIDPIEKKPLFHFHPGSKSYSIATVGCNFHCLFCQNYEISQMPKDEKRIAGEPFPPEEVVAAAEKLKCQSISYTYTEPTIFFEYAYDSARLANDRGIKNVFVSNGYMSQEAIKTIQPYLHAANIDLKAYSEKFYKEICGAKLMPVLENLNLMKKLGIWVEVTTLIIPTLNDSEKELQEIAAFIRTELGPETPWHVSRFHPMYRLTSVPSTPVQTVLKAREIGLKAGLYYVYSGNIPGQGGENTYCHKCGALLIERLGFTILQYNVIDAKCPKCHAAVHGVGM